MPRGAGASRVPSWSGGRSEDGGEAGWGAAAASGRARWPDCAGGQARTVEGVGGGADKSAVLAGGESVWPGMVTRGRPGTVGVGAGGWNSQRGGACLAMPPALGWVVGRSALCGAALGPVVRRRSEQAWCARPPTSSRDDDTQCGPRRLGSGGIKDDQLCGSGGLCLRLDIRSGRDSLEIASPFQG